MKEHWKESKQKKWLKTATAEKRNHHFRPQLKTTTRTMRKRILMKRDQDVFKQVKQSDILEVEEETAVKIEEEETIEQDEDAEYGKEGRTKRSMRRTRYSR